MMWISNLPPFIPFFIAAILVLVTRGQVRNIILLATPVLGGLHLWLDVQPFVPMQASDTLVKATALSYPLTVFTYQLEFMRVDKLSLLFGYLFHIASFIAIVYALHVRDTTQQVAGLLYAGSALGAVFAGDLISLFKITSSEKVGQNLCIFLIRLFVNSSLNELQPFAPTPGRS